MPDVAIEKPITLDLLDTNAPGLSATSDMPVIETKPDSAATDEVKTTEDSATTEQPEKPSASDEPPKVAKGVQKRLDELVRQREDERRAREAAEARESQLLALLKERQAPQQPAIQEEKEPARPDRNAFTDPDAYDRALDVYVNERAAFIARREVRQQIEQDRKSQREAALAEHQNRIKENFRQRVDKAKEKYPDYSVVAENPNIAVSVPMAHAIAMSDSGPDIAYHLGKNPQEAARISQLPIPAQLMELGIIAAKLVQPAAPPRVSNAPAPIKPTVSGTTEAPVSGEEESMDAYAARRRKELAADKDRGVRR